MELLNKLSGSHSCTVLFNTTQSINALKINHPKTGVLDLTTQLCKVLESYFPSSTEINLLVREFFSSNYVPYEPSVLTYILKFSFSHSPFFGGGGGGGAAVMYIINPCPIRTSSGKNSSSGSTMSRVPYWDMSRQFRCSPITSM